MSRVHPIRWPWVLLISMAVALAVTAPVALSFGAEGATEPTAQPWLGVIPEGSTMIDASPAEAPGEVWAQANGTILRFTDAGGWETAPPTLDAAGEPVANLNVAGARATPDGALALLADGELFVRDPGGRIHLAGAPTPVASALDRGLASISPAVALPAQPARAELPDLAAGRPLSVLNALPRAAGSDGLEPTAREGDVQPPLLENSESAETSTEEPEPSPEETESAPESTEASAPEESQAEPEETEAPEVEESAPLATEGLDPDPIGPSELEPEDPQPARTGPPFAAESAATPEGPPSPAAEPSPEPASVPPLQPGEALYDAPLVAALSESGRAGAFVVPSAGEDGVRDAVLHFDGEEWRREPICIEPAPACGTPPRTFSVVAIGAVGVQHAWLLATGTSSEAGIVLLHRVLEGAAPVWRPVSLGSSPFALRQSQIGSAKVEIAPRPVGQPLTVTDRGVWVDATIRIGGSESGADATLFFDEAAGAVLGSWCDVTGEVGETLCSHPLGSPLGTGRSFAWDDGSTFGTRIVTGLGQGAMLRLSGDEFERIPGGGRAAGTEFGAAFSAPDDGWLGANFAPVRYSPISQPNRLRLWPVPFRHPLTALAPQPGKPIGGIESEVLAVGDQGEVARYVPRIGWSPETLLAGNGKAATPRLRAVAWPTPEAAFAVGDAGEMWRWRAETGLWESDPAKPGTAAVAVANFTGVAFDPGDPDRGYAIGKQGVLLGYGKQWTQEPLPYGLGEANFTSIAFAGSEAIVIYKVPSGFSADGSFSYHGGIIVNDGSGWRKDESINQQLAPSVSVGELSGISAIPERVAGLPDGGAAVATMGGQTAERQGAGAPWQAGREIPGYPVALGLVREGGALRMIASADNELRAAEKLAGLDSEGFFASLPPGQAPVILDPYPIPNVGNLLRETPVGWSDEEHESWSDQSGGGASDLPSQPDPVLAFMTDALGGAGWAVGGNPTLQTATVARYPDDGQSPPGASGSSLQISPGWAGLAIGGGAQCLGPCADLRLVGSGPWRWLPAAVARAAAASGVRAFINTGEGTAGLSQTDDFAHEEAGAAERLTLGAGALPVYQAPAPSNRDGAGSLDTFLGAFRSASAPLGSRPAGNGVVELEGGAATNGHPYYAFDSTDPSGGSGEVRVIVLDTSSGSLGTEQRCWLGEQLSSAALASPPIPAVVVGNRPIELLGDAAADTEALLIGGSIGCPSPAGGGASAYFFDAPQENRESLIQSGSESIPAFGTGSLGYLERSILTGKVPTSGFLIAEIDTRIGSRRIANRAPVVVRLIPNISELATDATDGTLLRRSQVALFEGLARRPRSGLGCVEYPSCRIIPPDPYVPIPPTCFGLSCSGLIEPEYRFTSSAPDIADFVARNPASTNPRSMLFDSKGDPVPDPTSGLLCAYNAGTTTVTLETGGLSYSTKITVQPGRVRRPCGTVPLRNPPRPAQSVSLEPFEFPEPEPTPREPKPIIKVPTAPAVHPAITHPTAEPPPPAVKAPTPPKAPRPQIVAPFILPPTGIAPLTVIVPPPPPPAAQPTPPSGTSPVTQPVTSPNPEDEEEPAVEMVEHMVAHRDLLGGATVNGPAHRRQGALLAAATTPGSGMSFGPPLVGLLMIALVSLAGTGVLARRRQPPLATETLRRYQ